MHQNTEENSKKKSISITDHKTVTSSESAAGATGTKGVFTVVKIDSKTEEKLPGATFTLQKMKYENGQFANEGNAITGITDKNGTLTRDLVYIIRNKAGWIQHGDNRKSRKRFGGTNTYNEKVFENPKTDHPVDANKTNTAPKTGDAARMELWLCIMSSALSIIFLSVRYNRKNRKI